ncbi:MAG TPA: response regulator [Bacteroidota bacterium]|jgi:CheY-like chemotaxis protein
MNKKILVVDDDPLFVELAKDIIEADGIEVVSAIHGADALEKLTRETVDLVICDIEMPVMDGISFSLKLRELNPTLPLVFVTGSTDEAILRRARALSAGNLIPKTNLVSKLASLTGSLLLSHA